MAKAGHAILVAALVGATYFLAGKLGLSLAIVNPSASAVWPPSGIAIGTSLLFGGPALVGVFAGAFLVNVTTTGVAWTSLLIAAGNTLEAVAVIVLARRFAQGADAFYQTHTAFRFAGIALAASAVSATIGSITLGVAGFSAWTDFGPVWATWWLGDATGALLFAPPIILWAHRSRWASRVTVGEGVFYAVSLAVGAAVFASPLAEHSTQASFLVVPLLVWSAYKFGPRVTSTTAVILTFIALSASFYSRGPFGPDIEELGAILAFDAFVVSLAVPLSTAMEERRHVGDQLRAARDDAEARVVSATRELRKSVARLEQSERELAEAQSLARLGSWSWDLVTGKATWSSALHDILGRPCGSGSCCSFEAYADSVHPVDRETARAVVGSALATGSPFAFEHRIVLPDGSSRVVLSRGVAIQDESGRAIFARGTAQDVTDHRAAEEALRERTLTRAFVRRLLTHLVREARVGQSVVRELGRRLGGEAEGRTVEDMVGSYRRLGLGDLRMTGVQGGSFHFTADDLIERARTGPQPTCFMTLSFLEAVVAKRTGLPALGSEVACQTRGDPECRFIVRARAADPPVAERVARRA